MNSLLINKGIHSEKHKTENEIRAEIGDFLNKSFCCKAYGILGFPKFVDGYYLLLITGRKIMGNINNKLIYVITQTRTEFIFNQVNKITKLIHLKKND